MLLMFVELVLFKLVELMRLAEVVIVLLVPVVLISKEVLNPKNSKSISRIINKEDIALKKVWFFSTVSNAEK